MATQITLTSGERITVNASVQAVESAIDGKDKVVEFKRDDAQPIHVVVDRIEAFEDAPERLVRPVIADDAPKFYAFRGTVAPVNQANGSPTITVLTAAGTTQELALAHVERDQSGRGYRFQKVTATAGPARTVAEAIGMLDRKAAVPA